MAIRLIIIHGMNNNLEGFHPLRDYFMTLGHECHLLTLPGHGNDRKEAQDFKTAFRFFDQRMKELIKEPYAVIAFSQGALYFQLWLEKNVSPKPLAQILLAPALYIRYQDTIETFSRWLPASFLIKSQTPKKLRRYFTLYIWEYRSLVTALKKYQSLDRWFRLPTLILVDPKDELVDVVRLKQKTLETHDSSFKFVSFSRVFKRRKAIGQHHVIFHPDFFGPDEWNQILKEIENFLKEHS
jgi:alpha-beta hydrolase superfamily lysophospholipase